MTDLDQEEDLREEEGSENKSLNTGNNKEENTMPNLCHKRNTTGSSSASSSSDGLQPEYLLGTKSKNVKHGQFIHRS